MKPLISKAFHRFLAEGGGSSKAVKLRLGDILAASVLSIVSIVRLLLNLLTKKNVYWQVDN